MSLRAVAGASSLGLILLAGCGGGNATTQPSSSSSSSPASQSSQTSSTSEMSSTSSTSTSSQSSSSTSEPTTSVSSTGGTGALIDTAGLKSMATKLSCPSSQVSPARGTAQAKGAVEALQCTACTNEYLVIRTTTPEQVPNVMDAAAAAANSGKKMWYVRGSNWAVIVSGNNGKAAPTQDGTQAAQGKVGGAVTTTS